MKKSEIFDRVLDIVADECEVTKELIINDRKIQAVVVARCMCVYILKMAGLTSDDIALIVLRLQNCGYIDYSFCPSMKDIKSKAKTIDELYLSFYERYNNSRYFKLAYNDVRLRVLREYDDLVSMHEISTI